MSILERKLNILFDDDPDKGGNLSADETKDEPQKDQTKSGEKNKANDIVSLGRFNEVYEQKTKAEEELQKIKNAQAKAAEDALKEQNKWKELYESKEKEAAEKTKENLRLRVASKKDLPDDLVEFLKGETEQELEACADKLLAYLKVEVKGMPPIKRGGQSSILNIKDMSLEEIRKNSGKLLEQDKAGTQQ